MARIGESLGENSTVCTNCYNKEKVGLVWSGVVAAACACADVVVSSAILRHLSGLDLQHLNASLE